MSSFLLTLLCLVAYACGLAVIIYVTPRLLKLNYDEGLFMGLAASDILGGMLAFGPVAITFALFNGAFGVRFLDCLLLVGIGIVGLRMALRSFRPRIAAGTARVSRILVGSYCLLLFAAALYSIVLLFVAS